MSTCRVCEAETNDAFLCLRCFRQLERATAEMPSLLGDLTAVITRRTKVYRAPGRVEVREPTYDPEADVPAWLRTSEGRIALRPTALPVNLDATELLWVALQTLGSWARIIAEHHGIGGPTSENLLVWLTANIEAVRWQDDAAEAHDEITSLHRDLERAVDNSALRIYRGPCQADGCERDLYAPPSSESFECDGWRQDGIGCGRTYTKSEQREWLRDTIGDQLVTLDEFLEAAPELFPDLPQVPRASVLGWVRDGRLMAHGQNRVGQPTYKGSEFLELMENYRPKRYAPRRKRCA